MAVVSIATLKSYFETGDFPTQSNFVDLIDTLTNISSSTLTWTDYSSTSTIVGWSSYTTKILRYCTIGKVMFIHYYFAGTSNSVLSTFTIPATANNSQSSPMAAIMDNSVPLLTNGYVNIVNGASTLVAQSTGQGGGWTASGSKVITGSLFIQIN